MAGKYSPLKIYLEGVPMSRREVLLRFANIEKILAEKLPKSADEYLEWWANQSYGSQAASWLDAGFVVDTVDLKRKLVNFKRGSKPIGSGHRKGLGAKKKIKTRRVARPLAEKVLLDASFVRVCEWSLTDGAICIVGTISSKPAVYAHVVDGAVFYIGSATRSLKHRMYSYTKPGPSQHTNIRINKLLHEQLSQGRAAWIIAAFPNSETWNGLTVDMVAGLEGGLIKQFSPPWNMRGA